MACLMNRVVAVWAARLRYGLCLAVGKLTRDRHKKKKRVFNVHYIMQNPSTRSQIHKWMDCWYY